MEILEMLGRSKPIFIKDIENNEEVLREIIKESSFLVLGGAGTIGQAVVKQLFIREPRVLDVVDISENNLVELVRDLRSSKGYIKGDFRTFALDCGSPIFEAFLHINNDYDYIFNLTALKHVRSEDNPYTIMRMIEVNILNTVSTIEHFISAESKKYFAVSTDKAANPVNMMGASKSIMELFLLYYSQRLPISTARFANVAFSDGSLLHGFLQRFAKKQPVSAPKDTLRFFVTGEESGQLCLLSAILGDAGEVFFPKESKELQLTSFPDIARRYFASFGYELEECFSEEEARNKTKELLKRKKWPCYFFESDTTGEKPFEEFYTSEENPVLDRFDGIGVIKKSWEEKNTETLHLFLSEIQELLREGAWTKQHLVNSFNKILPKFDHVEKGKYLNSRM